MELLELLGALTRRERQPDLRRPQLGPPLALGPFLFITRPFPWWPVRAGRLRSTLPLRTDKAQLFRGHGPIDRALSFRRRLRFGRGLAC